MPPSSSDSKPLGRLDSPASGSTLPPRPAHVLGWAADAKRSLAVEIDVDGHFWGLASLGMPRPDVAAALGPAYALSGWEALIDLEHAALPEQRVRIEAFVRTPGGTATRSSIGSIELKIASPPPADPAERVRIATLRSRLDQLLAAAAAGVTTSDPAARPIRVLVVLHSFGRAGSQLILLERLRDLTTAGAVEVVAVSPVDGPLRQEFERFGCPCHLTASLSPPTEAEYEGRIAELALWAKPQAFDLVIANTASTSAAIGVAERLEVPSLWMLYDEPIGRHLSPHLAQNWPAYANAQALAALERATWLVFDSNARRLAYAQLVGHEHRHQMKTILGGVDLAAAERFRSSFDRTAARHAIGLSDDMTLLLLHGSIYRHKGTPLLAQAFANLALEKPGLHLALVGDQGDPLTAAIESYLTAMGLRERVFIEPMRPNVERWIAMADLVVCPSDRESLPRTVLEGMAFGVPVLATSVGDLPAVLEDGVTGWLVPPSQPPQLEAGLRRALSASPEKRREMVEAASKVVRERHDARRAAADFAALIQSTVARDPPRG